MSNIKNTSLYHIIPKSMFQICQIDGISLSDISKKYTKHTLGKSSVYAIDKFEFYLNEKHNMSLKDYIIKYLNYVWPKCPIKNIDVGYKIGGEGVRISRFARGGVSREFSPELDEFYKRISVERRGSGNPMFKGDPWNKGLTKEDDERLVLMGEKTRNRVVSEETKIKQSLARRNHPLKSRHSVPHTPETCEKLRKSTASLWRKGVFNKTTSIHLKMRDFLNSLILAESFEEEHQVKYFSMDFAFPKAKVAIECQGSYYHIDPRIYPDGPINAMQRRNFGRDKAKRKICCDQEGWIIIEVWEPEINDGTFKSNLLCKLKELNLLKV